MARKTVYCVQPYSGRPGRLEKGLLRQFGTPIEALQSGAELSRRVAGVFVFSVSGEPDFEQWEAPRLLAAHGDVPAMEF